MKPQNFSELLQLSTLLSSSTLAMMIGDDLESELTYHYHYHLSLITDTDVYHLNFIRHVVVAYHWIIILYVRASYVRGGLRTTDSQTGRIDPARLNYRTGTEN